MMLPFSLKVRANWSPVSKRILLARLVSNHTKMTIIVCYALANDADDEEKYAFCNMSQSVTKDVPRHDMICVVGDINAKVGAYRP